MSNENPNVAEGAVATKKVRRGISNQTQAVSQLKFHEKDANPSNGLFIAHLDEVRVDWSNSAESKSFPGISVPRLTFHFASNHPNVSERRHAYHTLFPVESNVNTIPNGSEEWKVNQVFNAIKHLLDVFYLKGREMTEAEEDALSLPFVDFDDEGNYISVDPEEVVAGYRVIFENAAAMLNGTYNLADGETPKACFKDASGKPLTCWIKLLRHKRVKGSWNNVTSNGDLGFDSFIGNGIVELWVKDKAPSVLRIDSAKESITPKETKKAPTIGNPAMNGMGGVMPGGPMMPGMDNAAFDAAAEDMPF